MTPRTSKISIIATMICLAQPAWAQKYLLYTPQTVASGQQSSSQDGVLVQEITIRKGDTLYGLSRKFSGHGMYYPQILLFNQIKNPGMIYTGNTLRIPLSHAQGSDSATLEGSPVAASKKASMAVKKQPNLNTEAQPLDKQVATSPAAVSSPGAELSLSDLKGVAPDNKKGADVRKKPLAQAAKSQTPKNTDRKTTTEPASAGQKLFEAAMKAYRKDDCRAALELFDRYLVDNSASPLAADVDLYKAECYFKLSTQ